MFPFDQTALPQLKPRRALIAVDFQNEFTSTDGALPVPEPAGYVDRTIQLASALRETGGDVIWVRSKFDGSRAVTGEKIIVSDDSESEERTSPPPASQAESPLLSRTSRGRGVPAALKAIAAARRRDRPSTSVSAPSPPSADAPVEAAGDPDPEAFLSKDEPACLKDPSSPASDWSLKVKDAMAGKKDRSLIKSHYSAFNGTRLLHVLRASMVMEIFICGSLANVGVYATAMDAAGHGLSITIVEDCCGYRSEARQRQAIESLVDYTGCEVASMKEVFETVGLEPEEGRDDSKKHEKGEDDIEVRSGADDTGRVSDSPDLVNPMTGLRLKSKSTSPQGAPADVKFDINGSAPCDDGEAEIKADSPPKSKLGETAGIDQVVSTTHDKEEDKDDEEESTSEAANPKPPSSSTEPKTVDMTPQLQPDSDSDSESLPAQKNLCEGDTDIIEDVLPPALEAGVFDKLRDEIRWQRMSHQGGEVPRLVAVQGDVAADGSMPVYRHPSDESPPLLPFSPTVLAIKAATEKHLGHPLNHALIQYYRDGKDYISEHSDKTLDIVKNSFIANVSLGAQRTMVLRTKRQHKDPSLAQQPPPSAETTPGPGRQTQRAQLPHNSLCRMGLQTNMKWLHAIRQDKRAERDKTAAELAFAGARISLTFRRIGTFLDKDESTIWGQGATGKTREEAKPVVNGTGPEAIEMLKAFGAENHSSTFDWEGRYGGGFDVLHMSSSPRFFASTDPVANLRIAVMMAELGMEWAKGVMGPAAPDDGGDLPIKFVDNDEEKSTVNGELAIMLYLDSTHGQGADYQRKWKGTARAKLYTRFQEALTWTKNIQKLQKDGQEDDETDNIKPIRKTLGSWNIAAAEKEEEGDEGGSFLAGSTPTLADFVVWPTLHSLVAKHGDSLFEDAGSLKEYYDAFGSLESVKKAVGRMPLS